MAEYTPVDMSQKTVEDMTFSCLDFKFLHAFDGVMANQGIDKMDGPRWAGPSKTIASGFANEMLTTIHGLHGFNRLHILDHVPCGAFKDDYPEEADQDLMAETHLLFQERAVQVVHNILPQLTVVTYVVGPEKVLDRRVFSND